MEAGRLRTALQIIALNIFCRNSQTRFGSLTCFVSMRYETKPNCFRKYQAVGNLPKRRQEPFGKYFKEAVLSLSRSCLKLFVSMEFLGASDLTHWVPGLYCTKSVSGLSLFKTLNILLTKNCEYPTFL